MPGHCLRLLSLCCHPSVCGCCCSAPSALTGCVRLRIGLGLVYAQVQLSAIRVRRWGTSSTHTQLPPTARTRNQAGHVSLGASATVATPLPRRDGELLIVDRLKLTVKPRLNPVLSQYLIDLTGITQQEVDEEGVDLAEVQPCIIKRAFYRKEAVSFTKIRCGCIAIEGEF